MLTTAQRGAVHGPAPTHTVALTSTMDSDHEESWGPGHQALLAPWQPHGDTTAARAPVCTALCPPWET